MKLFLILLCIIQTVFSDYNHFHALIVGGDRVQISKHPHMAFFSIECHQEVALCGSSILNQKLLLTAAHCLEDCPRPGSGKISITVGDSDKYSGKKYTGKTYRIHEHYNSETMDNDVAIILVAESIAFGPDVKRIALTKNKPKASEKVFIAGWGITDEDNPTSTRFLKGAPELVLSDSNCQNYLGTRKPVGTVCTIAKKINGKYGYAASGDSGSPLVRNNYIQIGIVSYKDDGKRDVVVYTNIVHHYTWITQTAAKLACSG